jgi:hypothetical protein
MFGISRVMLIGWITLALAVLALPQFVALMPESYLPIVTCAAGVLTLLVRLLSGGFGVNPLSAVAILTFAAGLLGGPFWTGVLPLTWMPVVTGIAAICTLIARFYAGQSYADPTAPKVNLLMEVK